MPTDDTLRLLFPVVTPFVAVFGACVGSFLNVVVWRLPRGESLWSPPSHCPKCGHAIRAWENVPILSWLFLRGRCSQCGLPISLQYPLVELATMLLFLAVWWRVSARLLHPAALVNGFYLAGAVLAASWIDIRHRRIPDLITWGGMITAVAAALLWPAARSLAAGGADPGVGDGFLVRLAAEHFLPAVAEWPRALALADVVLGAAVGAFFLLAVRQVGVVFWGYRDWRVREPAAVTLTGRGVEIGAEYAATWEELDARMADRLLIWFDNAEVEWADDGPAEARVEWPRGRVLAVAGDGQVRVGRRRLGLDGIRRIGGSSRHWAESREVLGLGDVKLAAMLGALLGAEAMPFVLLLAGVAGAAWGVVRLGFADGRRPGLPFGPFLGVGGLAWLFAGPELVGLYLHWLVP